MKGVIIMKPLVLVTIIVLAVCAPLTGCGIARRSEPIRVEVESKQLEIDASEYDHIKNMLAAPSIAPKPTITNRPSRPYSIFRDRYHRRWLAPTPLLISTASPVALADQGNDDMDLSGLAIPAYFTSDESRDMFQ